MENLIIEPLKGYGDIKFGMSIDEVVNVFGTPSNHEELEPIIEGNEISSILYDYDDIAVSVCFEGTDKLIVSSISTINEDATLFGEKIYEMNRNQIIDLMKRNGYKEFDEEEQEGDNTTANSLQPKKESIPNTRNMPFPNTDSYYN